MKIEEFINLIENAEHNEITRGAVIDYLADNTDNWILVLKALLIVNPNRFIHTVYLLQKLRWMQENPEHQHLFLSIRPLNIYNILKGNYG